MGHLLGIDIGTQGVKAVLYTQEGAFLAEAFRASQPHCPEPGVLEENPETQVASVLEVIRETLSKAAVDGSQVGGLGIAGQMAGVIGIGDDGRAVTPYDSWLDTRCAPYIHRMQQTAGEDVLRRSGNAPSFNHGPKILWWKHERPVDYSRVRKFVQPSGYAAMRLCGLKAADAFIDWTYLHFSGFADNVRLAWDEDLCERLGVDAGKLPRISRPSAVVGEVTPEMAKACGLRTGIRVVAGCGDSTASFLACGALQEGICVDVAGTASVFAATTRSFLPDTKARVLGCCRSVLPDLWHSYAYINGGGQNLSWFRNSIAGARMTFAELDALSSGHEGDEHLPYFIPHLGGRVSPAWPSLRGAWADLDWGADLGSMFRAMLDSVALEYGLYKGALEALLPEFKVREVRVTGGGEKSRIWNQLKADRLQVPVVGIQGSGGAPMGAALLAGAGVGIFPDLEGAAGKWIKLGAPHRPDPSKAELSRHRIERYSALLDMIKVWNEKT
jgi:xylulokinase